MKKEDKYDIGIISFSLHSDGYNFGAALHSYAFQKYLDKLEISNVIVNYFPKSVWKSHVLREILHNLIKFQFIRLYKNLIKWKYVHTKKVKFHNFFKKHCNITNNQYNVKTLSKLVTISRFVCETDVTWAKLRGGYDRGFLCDLPNMKNKDNIAYSVDFGAKELSDKNKNKLKNFAKNFKYISIRNIFKLDYFKNIIERDDVIITIDPVFLLEKEDYDLIANNDIQEKNYVLVYNCQENHPKMIQNAMNFAKENNLEVKIINSFMNNYEKIEDSYPTPIGIEDFLGMVKNCKYLFTNSYHGICFSIIFEKEFWAFSRKANNDKILTILELFNLRNRFVENDILLDRNNINFKEAKNTVNELKLQSQNFIKDSILKRNYK